MNSGQYFSTRQKLVSESGTNVAPLMNSGNRGFIILFVLMLSNPPPPVLYSSETHKNTLELPAALLYLRVADSKTFVSDSDPACSKFRIRMGIKPKTYKNYY
jgi:hypothetical protein